MGNNNSRIATTLKSQKKKLVRHLFVNSQLLIAHYDITSRLDSYKLIHLSIMLLNQSAALEVQL